MSFCPLEDIISADARSECFRTRSAGIDLVSNLKYWGQAPGPMRKPLVSGRLAWDPFVPTLYICDNIVFSRPSLR